MNIIYEWLWTPCELSRNVMGPHFIGIKRGGTSTPNRVLYKMGTHDPPGEGTPL